MNVLILPSWYPSKHQPHTGIFFKEQAEALAHVYHDSNFAISTWGSHDLDLLLYGKDHLKNLPKLVKFLFKQATKTSLRPNLTEYYYPAFTWTRKIRQGNIKNIIRVNEKHLTSFQEEVGKVDIIHAHSAYPAGWAAMELSIKYKIPYIITEHMAPFPFKSFLLKSGSISPYLALPFKGASSNVVVSPQQKEALSKFGIPHLEYIPNLTDESLFKPLPQTAKANSEFTFFTLAVQEDRKGIAYLLRAFKKLYTNYPNIHLRIGGNGPRRAKYQELAVNLEISDKIEWLGTLNRQQTIQEHQKCDAFVLPSFKENLPLVLIEASACGKPLIGTYCGGSESIIHEKNGLVVEPGNVVALYEAMEDMYLNYQRYNAEEIRADFMSSYSRPVVCGQIMDLYQEVINQHKTTT